MHLNGFTGAMLASAIGGLTACASNPVTLGSRFAPDPPAARESTKTTSIQPCRMQLGSVTDERANPGEIANLYQRSIRHENVTDWLRNGLRSLDRQGVKLEANEAGSAPNVPVLDVALIKAYLQPLSTSKSANLVVRARVSHDGNVTAEHLYRGRDTGMSWTGSQSEIEAAFNLALRDLLARIAPDLRSQCG